MSARYHMNDLSNLLRGKKVAIMHRQIARHEVHEERKLTWATKARRGFARAFNKLKSILRV